MFKFIKFFSLFIFMGLVIDGCGFEQKMEKPEEQVNFYKEGLSIFEAKEDGTIKGGYRKKDKIIFFDTHRGNKTAFQDEVTPPYEIDVMFRNAKGEKFSVLVGGHDFQNPAWKETWLYNEVTPEERATEFQLANEAGEALKNKNFHMGLEWEKKALVNLALSVKKEDIQVSSDIVKKSNLIASSGYSYQHVLEIWKKSCCINGLTGAEHSATWNKSYYVTPYKKTLLQQIITSNHGASANQSTMSLGCRRYFPNRTRSLPQIATCGTTPGNWVNHSGCFYGCCNSNYGILSGNHVCNDDSRLQKDVMIAGGMNFCVSYCSDSIPAKTAPGCY